MFFPAWACEPRNTSAMAVADDDVSDSVPVQIRGIDIRGALFIGGDIVLDPREIGAGRLFPPGDSAAVGAGNQNVEATVAIHIMHIQVVGTFIGRIARNEMSRE